jgi:uncharacterized membrane protein YkoI
MGFPMQNRTFHSTFLAVVLLSAPPLVLASEKLEQKLAAATVRLQDAINAAEQATGGRAYEAKLEKNSFGVEYEVEVLAEGKKLEVSVDAQTAKVMGIRKDD